MEVAAIVVNYHLAHGAIRAAESILAQDVPVQVWVVDNSQSQDQAHLLRSTLGDRCRVLVNEDNVGFGAACNQVYEQTRSEFVFLLNPDAYCLPGALPALLQFLRTHPRAGAAGPRVCFDDAQQLMLPPLRVPSRWYPLLYMPQGRVSGTLVWLYSLYWRAGMIRYWQATQPVSHAGLAGGQVLLRREALERAGGLFDPQFYLFYEDADLSLRLRAQGFSLHTVPEAVVVHTPGGTFVGRQDQKARSEGQAGARFMHKHYGQNRRCGWTRRVVQRLRRSNWQPRATPVPDTSRAPTWPVPPAWRDGWLLEICVGPHLLHAGGMFGTGPTAQIPAEIWSGFRPGVYFARLGPARAAWLPPEVWQWTIEPGIVTL